MSEKELIKSTKKGPVKYFSDVNIENTERYVWKNGKKVNNGKSWKAMEFDNYIGAKYGKKTKYIRVEETAGVIHGHTITPEEYYKLTR